GLVARPGGSSISLKIETANADTILKIQWKNVTIAGHPAGDSLNFQFWLHKGSQQIEFRYGPSHITNIGDTIQVTTVFLSSDFVNDYENHQVTGSGTSVTDDFDSLIVKPYFGAVPDGTV